MPKGWSWGFISISTTPPPPYHTYPILLLKSELELEVTSQHSPWFSITICQSWASAAGSGQIAKMSHRHTFPGLIVSLSFKQLRLLHRTEGLLLVFLQDREPEFGTLSSSEQRQGLLSTVPSRDLESIGSQICALPNMRLAELLGMNEKASHKQNVDWEDNGENGSNGLQMKDNWNGKWTEIYTF